MGLADTRVKNKKGKLLVVITPAVRDFIKGFEVFVTALQNLDEEDSN